MREENEVSGCLIERKGKYYVVLYYYAGDKRLSETKATGIAVKDHKKRDAERMKLQMIEEKRNSLTEQKKLREQKVHPFADCLLKWADYKASQVEGSTAATYKDKVKTPAEYFRKKNMMIENLTPQDLLAYYEWALKYGRRNVYKEGAKTGLARRTVRDQATLIKSFLNDAIVQGVITTNPASLISVPRVKEDNVKEIAFLTLEQAKEFLKFVRITEKFQMLYPICKFGLYYGLRRSEIMGLRWNAFDFEKNQLEICHTVIRIGTELELRDNVKTKSSHRYLPLLDDIKETLDELKKFQKDKGIYKDDGYIITWEDGRVVDPDYISKLFRKAVKACPDVPKNLSLHGLRHSCCAILFEKGWDLGTVQNWLGHQDVAVTANIYNHVSKHWKNEHGKEIDGLFKGA